MGGREFQTDGQTTGGRRVEDQQATCGGRLERSRRGPDTEGSESYQRCGREMKWPFMALPKKKKILRGTVRREQKRTVHGRPVRKRWPQTRDRV